jgi:hypothetical protein
LTPCITTILWDLCCHLTLLISGKISTLKSPDDSMIQKHTLEYGALSSRLIFVPRLSSIKIVISTKKRGY